MTMPPYPPPEGSDPYGNGQQQPPPHNPPPYPQGQPPPYGYQQQPYGQVQPPYGYSQPPYPQAPPPYGPGFVAPGYTVAPKNPGLALLASFFIPGLGTLMNGQTGKGIGIFIGWLVGAIASSVLIGIPFAFGFWLWGVIDAYQGAQAWNARHGIIS